MEHEDRQWFTLAGYVELSDPAGDQCTDGLEAVESRISGIDILIGAGFSLVGAIAGAYACDDKGDPQEYAACVTGLGTLGPALLSSRTVSYSCKTSTVGYAPEPSLLPPEGATQQVSAALPSLRLRAAGGEQEPAVFRLIQ